VSEISVAQFEFKIPAECVGISLLLEIKAELASIHRPGPFHNSIDIQFCMVAMINSERHIPVGVALQQKSGMSLRNFS
jgi:hypothetical protein